MTNFQQKYNTTKSIDTLLNQITDTPPAVKVIITALSEVKERLTIVADINNQTIISRHYTQDKATTLSVHR